MANGSRHSMRYVAEATYGTTPATPAFKPIRHTSTTLGLSKESLQSEEIRDDRQIADFRHGAYQVGGDMNIELSFASFDDLLEATLLGTWVANTTTGGRARRADRGHAGARFSRIAVRGQRHRDLGRDGIEHAGGGRGGRAAHGAGRAAA